MPEFEDTAVPRLSLAALFVRFLRFGSLADQAWLYVTLLTIGYMISRGLAKAGSSAHRDA